MRREYTFPTGNTQAALEFAHALVEEGVVTAQHCRTGRRAFDLSKAMASALEGFTNRVARPKHDKGEVTGLYLQVEQSIDDLGECRVAKGHKTLHERFKVEPDVMPASFALTFETSYFYCIGPALEDLQAAVPGLGRRVLEILTRVAWNDVLCFTPPDAYHWAQGTFWQGEADEEMSLEELADSEREWFEKDTSNKGKVFDPDQVEFFRKRDIDACIPSWAGTKFHGHKPLAKEKWERFCAGGVAQASRLCAGLSRPGVSPELDSQLWHICQLARTLELGQPVWADPWDNPLRHYEFTTHETGALLLRWTNKDCCQHVFDETIRNWVEGGEFQGGNVALFPFFTQRPESIHAALEKLQHALENFAKLEALVQALNDYKRRTPRPHQPLPKVRHQKPKRPAAKTLCEVLGHDGET